MIKADVITLIGETPKAHGIFEEITETRRDVYCEVRSVGLTEFYKAMEQDIRPACVFVLADYAEYRDEKIVEWHGKRMRVVRTYIDRQRIELTVEEATVDKVVASNG